MTSILITGSNGFIGSYLKNRLHNKGYTVHGFNRQSFQDSPNNISSDIIIHCAANANIREGSNPHEIWKSNVELTHQILDRIKPFNSFLQPVIKPLFINLSSVAVYGKMPEGKSGWKPKEEDYANPTTSYGMSKLASEFLVNKYTDEGKIVGVNLRLGGVCGPHMTHGILEKIVRHGASFGSMEFANPSPGNQMTYIHVSCVAKLIEQLIDVSPLAYGTYNVCSQNSASIEDIFNMVKKLQSGNGSIKWVDKPGFKNDNSVFLSDTTKISSLIKVPTIEESIQMVIDDYSR